jgi:hypothetical protein
MRENRPYGSEGGEANAFPTPIVARDAFRCRSFHPTFHQAFVAQAQISLEDLAVIILR